MALLTLKITRMTFKERYLKNHFECDVAKHLKRQGLVKMFFGGLIKIIHRLSGAVIQTQDNMIRSTNATFVLCRLLTYKTDHIRTFFTSEKNLVV